MRRWIFAPTVRNVWLWCAAAAAGVGFVSLPAHAQVRAAEVSLEAPLQSPDIDRLLQQGSDLERARRWGDALGHYEAAVKQHPERRELIEGLSRSRVHFDLTRRYADSSFLRSCSELTTADAQEVYGEVLLKIQTHHVDAPQWSELVRRGVVAVEAALSEPEFHKRHLATVKEEAVAAFAAQLPKLIASRVIRTRADAQQAAADVAYHAAQQLGIPEPVILLEFTCGAAGALDEYSSFLTAAQLEDVFSQIEGNFVGLGIELKTLEHALEIVGVIAGSPAERGGLKIGDQIVAVDGRSARDHSPDSVADLLKGPEGSRVTVTVVGQDRVTRRLSLHRQRVDVPSVDKIQIVDRGHGIGYFRISSFQKTTSRDVDAALWKLHREGMRYLIIDVRGNPGGLLNAAVEISDKFVQDGTIVSTRGRSPQEDFDYKANSVGTWRVPLVVLIDSDSASASEIFAGAVRDHRRATIVGSRSYGKGSVQGIFPLHVSKAGVRLTTAKFYSPSGQAISQRGISPDLEVHATAKPVVDEEGHVSESKETAKDAVLEAGLQVARAKLAGR